MLDAFLPQPEMSDVRGWEWFYLQSLLANKTNVYEPQLGGINNVQWSPDGRLVAIGGRRGAQIYDPTSRQVVRSLPGHTRTIWSPNGLRLATVTKVQGKQFVQIWNTESWQVIDKLVGGGTVNVVAWSPDSSSLAWATGGRFSLWREGQKKAEPIRRPAKTRFGINSVAWGSEGRLLLLGGAASPIWFVTGTPSNEKLTHSFNGGARGLTHIAVHPDGTRFVNATLDGELDIREAEDGKLVHRFRAHNGHVSACDYSRDGECVVSGGGDNLVRIVNANTGQQVNQFPGHGAIIRSVDWSPTEDLIVSGSDDGTVRFWRPDESRDACGS